MRTTALALALFAWTQPAPASDLRVLIHPSRLAVDAQNRATVSALITNVSNEPVPILLTLTDFRIDENEFMPAKVQFSLATADSTPLAQPNTPPSPEFERAPLPPGESIRVRIQVSDLWQAGVSTSSLLNHGQPLATIEAVKDQFPFNVKLLGWKEDAPFPLRFSAKTAASILLKNEDPQTYDIDWTLYGENLKPQTGHVRIQGQFTTPINFDARPGWIPKWYAASALLRPRESDGVLRLVATSRNPQDNLRWKEVTIPVKIRTSFWSDYAFQWVIFLILASFIGLGGIASFLLTYWIPNRLRRVAIRELIESSSPKIRAVSPTIASSLRVGVRVERQRLLQRLDSRSTISPDFAALANECEAAAHRLLRVINLLERTDVVLRKIDRDWPNAGVHGPTLLRRACLLLGNAQSHLDRPEVTDDMIARAQAIVEQAEGTITSAETLDAKMADEVSLRVAALRRTLTRRLGSSLSLTTILKALPSLNDGLDEKYEKAAEFNTANFCDLDLATTKLELIERFVEAFEAVVDSKKAVAQEHLRRFMEALRRTSFAAFRDAEAIVEQTEELVFVDDAQKELKSGRARIRFDPQSPKVNQAVSFRLEFDKRSLNGDAARNALTCTWHFQHTADLPPPSRFARWREKLGMPSPPVQADHFDWMEEGFAVSHYFPTPDRHKVWVEFSDSDGLPLESQPGQRLKIEQTVTVSGTRNRPWGERTRIEVMRLSIALGAAIFALLGGAQEQLTKVDLVPGLIAVFLLGFSADQIKNVFK